MTGLIYVILIAVWVVVLVPRFIRHHDESRRRRESERLEAALAPEATFAGDESDHRAGSWAEYLRSLTNVDASVLVGQVRAPQGRHARRRRTIVLGLSTTMTVSVAGAVLGVLPGFLAVVTAVLLGGYVAAVVTQVRRGEVGRSATAGGAVAEPAVRAGRAASASTDGVRVVQHDSGAGSTWEPLQTTLPTYVSKPKASRIPRRIDLTREGWTGADMVQEARRRQGSPELQEQFEREFAVVAPDEDQEVADYAYPDAENGDYYRRAVNE